MPPRLSKRERARLAEKRAWTRKMQNIEAFQKDYSELRDSGVFEEMEREKEIARKMLGKKLVADRKCHLRLRAQAETETGDECAAETGE